MKMRTLTALLILVPLAACPGTQPPSSTPTAGGSLDPVVSGLIESATELAGSRGFTPSTRPVTGALNNGTQEDVEISLNAGREYLMFGMCDGDCTDLDLQLFDSSGNKLDEDVLEDDSPILEFRVPSAGNHRIRVVMASCSADPCAYGVALYHK